MHLITYIAGAILLTGFVAYSAYGALQVAKKKRADGSSFPGPRLFPLVGRVHDLPVNYMWLKFKEWADIYGPIYSTSMFGSVFIIVSDEEIAEELLVKRAKYNSDRPQMRSVTDSKSSEGGMEYLPLMGKNSEMSNSRCTFRADIIIQNTGLVNVASVTHISPSLAMLATMESWITK